MAQVDQVRRSWDYVCDWIAANMPRFDVAYDGAQPRLGWRMFNDANYGDTLYVIPNQLSDALKAAGFNAAKSLRGFCEKGYLVGVQEKDKNRYTTKRVVNGQRQRVLVFKYPLVKE